MNATYLHSLRFFTVFCVLLLSLTSAAKDRNALFDAVNTVQETVSSASNAQKFYAVEEISVASPSYDIENQWDVDAYSSTYFSLKTFSYVEPPLVSYISIDHRAQIYEHLFPFHFFY
ncbi:hypothetical protein RBU60_03500 [Mesonia sp. MT50]|uniref:Uncharacterized protein n=1 Tax=Mesonia profundi TaxID=3070998 RepID=A0ABU0ZYT5_9FLAO|nr:hypothetical protein [Mesonia profundi]MDQ7916628.1 hypothetical protein [Mesonia profundi]